MEFRFAPDGSFDLAAGGFGLAGAYPSVDGVPVRPLRTVVSGNEARYELLGGALTVRVDREGDLLAVRCAVEGLGGAHDISPVGGARITGCDRVFKQGLGISGPSGFRRRP